MKYFIEYYHPDIDNEPYVGFYNIHFKKHWWSRKVLIRKDYHASCGLTTVMDNVINPHLKSMCTYDFISDGIDKPYLNMKL